MSLPTSLPSEGERPQLSKQKAVTLIQAGAALAIESLDSILRNEGYARAKSAFEYASLATEFIEGHVEGVIKYSFDAALAYAEGVTLEQLVRWQNEMQAEGMSSLHTDAAIIAFQEAATPVEGGPER